jgi:hypothetical protein
MSAPTAEARAIAARKMEAAHLRDQAVRWNWQSTLLKMGLQNSSLSQRVIVECRYQFTLKAPESTQRYGESGNYAHPTRRYIWGGNGGFIVRNSGFSREITEVLPIEVDPNPIRVSVADGRGREFIPSIGVLVTERKESNSLRNDGFVGGPGKKYTVLLSDATEEPGIVIIERGRKEFIPFIR